MSRCEYRDEGGISPESKSLIIELFDAFKQLSTADTIQVLNEAAKENEALAILAIVRDRLKDAAEAAGSGSKKTTVGSPSSKSDGSYELEMHNPIAYPSLSRRDSRLFTEKDYRTLIEPMTTDTSPSR
jgi:hypothetical protein